VAMARYEAASRPEHFAGVATVVTKLFNIVRPHRSYFGLKDYQQVQVVRQITEGRLFPGPSLNSAAVTFGVSQR